MITKFTGQYKFLSNFFACEVEYEGIAYPSSEHAFQAAKTLDRNERIKIARASSPGMAKTLGRHVSLRRDWEETKDSIMGEILHIKFSNPELKDKLLRTGDSRLVEGNTWGDVYWGVCGNKGKNKLGKLLMKVRESLKCQV